MHTRLCLIFSLYEIHFCTVHWLFIFLYYLLMYSVNDSYVTHIDQACACVLVLTLYAEHTCACKDVCVRGPDCKCTGVVCNILMLPPFTQMTS